MTKKKKTNKTTNAILSPDLNIKNTTDIHPVIPEKTTRTDEKMVHFDISSDSNDSSLNDCSKPFSKQSLKK